MNAIQTGIVRLIKSTITGDQLLLPDDFDIDMAYPMIKAHHITALAYLGALKCGVDQKKPAMQQLFQNYCRALQISQRQMQEFARVIAAFDENNIDYLPLKGCVMKAFYPRPEIRLMGDADVLIRLEQYDKIVPVMHELGFTEKKGVDRHFVWESDQLNLELHKYLVDSDFLDCDDYFQNGWIHAVAEDHTRYAMDDVNTFAFLFTHFAQHFSSAGIGCRHVVDLWVYLRSHPQMDQAYLKTVMQKMGLWEFYQNIRRMISVWFEGNEPDEKSEYLSQMIFSNGSWGSLSNATLNQGVQDMERVESIAVSRSKYIYRHIFPGVAHLKNTYPILRKRIWLLPVIWGSHIWNKTVAKRGNLRKHMKQLFLLNKDEIENRRNMLEYIGLSFEEKHSCTLRSDSGDKDNGVHHD